MSRMSDSQIDTLERDLDLALREIEEQQLEITRPRAGKHECGYRDYVAAERQLTEAGEALVWFGDEAGDVVTARAPVSVLNEIESARVAGGTR